MEYLQKESRSQLTLYTTCLDDMIAADNTVRAIDTFVDSLDLEQLGFASLASQGRLCNPLARASLVGCRMIRQIFSNSSSMAT
jgi:hypothetical protein